MLFHQMQHSLKCFFLEFIDKNVFGKNFAISRQDKFVYSLNTVTMIIVNNNQQKKVMVK